MSSTEEFQQQRFFKEMSLNDSIAYQIKESYDKRSEDLLKEINLPENLEKINEFFKNYRAKHTHKK
jgi:hypothetical protein